MRIPLGCRSPRCTVIHDDGLPLTEVPWRTASPLPFLPWRAAGPSHRRHPRHRPAPSDSRAGAARRPMPNGASSKSRRIVVVRVRGRSSWAMSSSPRPRRGRAADHLSGRRARRRGYGCGHWTALPDLHGATRGGRCHGFRPAEYRPVQHPSRSGRPRRASRRCSPGRG